MIDRIPLSPIQRVKADTAVTEQDWRYTSMLWEKAQSQGVVPRVTDKSISAYPPKFRVTIEFMGKQGSGTARNKKTAKHIAAKAVCCHLGYHVSFE